jgi:hypothetical protein
MIAEKGKYLIKDCMVDGTGRWGARLLSFVVSIVRRVLHPDNLFNVDYRLKVLRIVSIFCIGGLYMLK